MSTHLIVSTEKLSVYYWYEKVARKMLVKLTPDRMQHAIVTDL